MSRPQEQLVVRGAAVRGVVCPQPVVIRTAAVQAPTCAVHIDLENLFHIQGHRWCAHSRKDGPTLLSNSDIPPGLLRSKRHIRG